MVIVLIFGELAAKVNISIYAVMFTLLLILLLFIFILSNKSKEISAHGRIKSRPESKLKEKKKKSRKVYINLLLTISGLFWGYTGFSLESKNLQYWDNIKEGEVKHIRGTVEKKYSKKNNMVCDLSTSRGRIQLYFEKNSEENIRISRNIIVKCEKIPFKTADNVGNFDEKEYMVSDGILAKFKVISIEKSEGKYSEIGEFLYRFKCQVKENLYNICDKKQAGIFQAIILGDKDNIDTEIKELYALSGISHVLAISGLHISILGMTFYRIVRKFVRQPPAVVLSLFFMSLIVTMTGNSVSAIRALIMYIINLIGEIGGYNYDILSALSLAAILMLIKNPFYVSNGAFRLSFIAIVAISIVYKIVICYIGKMWKGYKEKSIRGRIIDGLVLNLSMSYTSMPVVACMFYRLPTYSVFLNIIVVGMMGIVVLSGFCASVFSFFSINIAKFTIGIGVCIIKLIEKMCNFSNNLIKSSVVTGNISYTGVVIYYSLFVLMLYTLHKISISDNIKKSRPVCFIWLPVVIALSIIVYRPKYTGVYVSFIDVGQGDCSIIHCDSGNNYMIDGGSLSEKETGRYKIKSTLNYMDIDEIKTIIVSHTDKDHISGILEIIKNDYIKVENIILPQIRSGLINQAYSDIEDYARKKNINLYYGNKSTVIKDGDMVLSFLNPDELLPYEDINEASSVVLMEYREFKALFTGDIGEKTEENIYRILRNEGVVNIDLLKVAHHGSRDSTTGSFLSVTKPDLAVISCGEGNIYGHPHTETLNRLKESKTAVFATRDFGQVTVRYKKNGEIYLDTYKQTN